jgi:hypothetical protein
VGQRGGDGSPDGFPRKKNLVVAELEHDEAQLNQFRDPFSVVSVLLSRRVILKARALYDEEAGDEEVDPDAVGHPLLHLESEAHPEETPAQYRLGTRLSSSICGVDDGVVPLREAQANIPEQWTSLPGKSKRGVEDCETDLGGTVADALDDARRRSDEDPLGHRIEVMAVVEDVDLGAGRGEWASGDVRMPQAGGVGPHTHDEGAPEFERRLPEAEKSSRGMPCQGTTDTNGPQDLPIDFRVREDSSPDADEVPALEGVLDGASPDTAAREYGSFDDAAVCGESRMQDLIHPTTLAEVGCRRRLG